MPRPVHRPRRVATRWSFPLVALIMAAPGAARAGAIVADGTGQSPRFTYETSGSIGTDGVSGKPLVAFTPASGSAAGSADFTLGAFRVRADPGDPVTHYDRTPFAIRYWTRSIDGASTAGPGGPEGSPLTITGWITGDAGGAGHTSLTIRFDQGVQPADPRYYSAHPLPPIPAGSAFGGPSGMPSAGDLTLQDGRDTSTLDGQGGTESPVVASVALAPNVPEPSSVLVMGGLALVGLVASRRSTRRA